MCGKEENGCCRVQVIMAVLIKRNQDQSSMVFLLPANTFECRRDDVKTAIKDATIPIKMGSELEGNWLVLCMGAGVMRGVVDSG